jgi:hypothetical protein
MKMFDWWEYYLLAEELLSQAMNPPQSALNFAHPNTKAMPVNDIIIKAVCIAAQALCNEW